MIGEVAKAERGKVEREQSNARQETYRGLRWVTMEIRAVTITPDGEGSEQADKEALPLLGARSG